MWEEKPEPLEKTDPELAEALRLIANKEIPYCVSNDRVYHAIRYGSKTALGAQVVRSEIKIGRNDSCICGSGKKYKKCCARKG